LTHNTPQIRDRLIRLKALIDGGWQRDIVRMMERARDTVSRLTPRSEAVPGVKASRKRRRHVADGWTLKVIGGKAKSRIPVLTVVYNRYTHRPDGKKLANAILGESRGHKFTVLEILEYGTRPHKILPKEKSVLHFRTREGEEVFTMHANHPGTRPYAMVRMTRAKLHMWSVALNRKWKRKIERHWRRG